MASKTLGWRWPTLLTPMPPAKSMYSRPSTSVSSAPSAFAMNRGLRLDTPRGTCRWRRSADFSFCLVLRFSLESEPEIRFLLIVPVDHVSISCGHVKGAVFHVIGAVGHLERLM